MRLHLFVYLAVVVSATLGPIPEKSRNAIGPRSVPKVDPRRFDVTPVIHHTPHAEYIESLPVDTRLRIISDLLQTRSFRSIRRKVGSYMVSAETWYANYLESLIFVELGVVRFIGRFARGELKPTEQHIRTVWDMVDFLRTSFLHDYGYSLDHITADKLIDLFDVVVPLPGEKRTSTFFRIPGGGPPAGPSVNDTEIVRMGYSTWHEKILLKHQARLQFFGCEFL